MANSDDAIAQKQCKTKKMNAGKSKNTSRPPWRQNIRQQSPAFDQKEKNKQERAEKQLSQKEKF